MIGRSGEDHRLPRGVHPSLRYSTRSRSRQRLSSRRVFRHLTQHVQDAQIRISRKLSQGRSIWYCLWRCRLCDNAQRGVAWLAAGLIFILQWYGNLSPNYSGGRLVIPSEAPSSSPSSDKEPWRGRDTLLLFRELWPWYGCPGGLAWPGLTSPAHRGMGLSSVCWMYLFPLFFIVKSVNQLVCNGRAMAWPGVEQSQVSGHQ